MCHSKFPNKLRYLASLVFLICSTSMHTAKGQQLQSDRYFKLKMAHEEVDHSRFARTAASKDRAMAYLDLSLLKINTYNFGLDMDGREFLPGAGYFPNRNGIFRNYFWTSGPAFAVEAGPWHPTALVHEASDYHDLSEIDWEAKDNARGAQFSDPSQTYLGYDVFAISDIEETWPSTGWPAPEDVQEVWGGTETWQKWKRVGDRNSFCVFDDSYAGRKGDGTSTSLGIEVHCRSIAYSSMNIIFFQYEYINTSNNDYTGVFIGHNCDKGGPTTDFENLAFAAGTLHYGESQQLIWYRAAQYDEATGTHRMDYEEVSFVGFMVLESPTGSFKEYPYDSDNPGNNYINDPTQALTRRY